MRVVKSFVLGKSTSNKKINKVLKFKSTNDFFQFLPTAILKIGKTGKAKEDINNSLASVRLH